MSKNELPKRIIDPHQRVEKFVRQFGGSTPLPVDFIAEQLAAPEARGKIKDAIKTLVDDGILLQNDGGMISAKPKERKR